jgi:hypothetical protein
MTNEEKAARLEGMAAKKDFAAEHAKSAVFGGGTWVAEFTADAALLREAAQLMRELNQLGPLGSSNQELFMVPWSEIKQRIAALTKQQPAACPRSEVRGVENNNA